MFTKEHREKQTTAHVFPPIVGATQLCICWLNAVNKQQLTNKATMLTVNLLFFVCQ